MHNAIRATIVAVLVLSVPTICLAQSKVPVLVVSTVGENDAAGQQMVFELKEAIRGSQGFRLVENSKQWPYIKFYIVTVQAVAGASTAAGYSIVYDNINIPLSGAYITGGAQYCGRSQSTSCARGLLSEIDSAVDSLQRTGPELHKTLK